MHLILDFDGTITLHDTTGALAQAAIRHHRRNSPPELSLRLQPAWEDAVRLYAADLGAYTAGYTPPRAQRNTPAAEEAFLAGLKPVEEASLARVSRAGLFGNLTPAHLARMGAEAVSSGEVTIREGYDQLLAWAAARRPAARVGVLSVNWSGHFVRGVLSAAGGVEPPVDVELVANEIDGAGNIVGPGGGSRLTTASDKLRALRGMVRARGDEDEPVVYVGDSPTDLSCLLVARRGIVMAGGREAEAEASLVRTLERIGLEVRHVAGGRGDGHDKTLSWARDLREVVRSGVLGGG